jgi:hypothetical protein
LYQFYTLGAKIINSLVINTTDLKEKKKIQLTFKAGVPGSILGVGVVFLRTFLPLLHIDIPFSCKNQE